MQDLHRYSWKSNKVTLLKLLITLNVPLQCTKYGRMVCNYWSIKVNNSNFLVNFSLCLFVIYYMICLKNMPVLYVCHFVYLQKLRQLRLKTFSGYTATEFGIGLDTLASSHLSD
jgi:hypothetical protein